jgi:hypothetical protein
MNEVYRAYVCNRVIAIIDDGSEEIVCDVLGKDSSLGAASRLLLEYGYSTDGKWIYTNGAWMSLLTRNICQNCHRKIAVSGCEECFPNA